MGGHDGRRDCQLRSDGNLLRSIVSRTVKLVSNGKGWKGCCPFHGEKTPSFHVYADGHFHCFGCQAHGTVVDFVMKSERLDFAEAANKIAGEAGIYTSKKTNPPPHGQDEKWSPIVPAPASKKRPDLSRSCAAAFEYVGPDGQLLFIQRRFEKAGDKHFGQLTYGTLTSKETGWKPVEGWHSRGPAQPYPLYRLDRLIAADAGSRVLVVEGEKACHAAERLFPDMVVTTWLNGANSVLLTDWHPLQRFAPENIVWWPDADKPRESLHGCFKATLDFRKLFPRTAVIDTTGLEEVVDGYDAADLEREAYDPDDFLKQRLREPEHALPVIIWQDDQLSNFANLELPPRLWIMEDWIPSEQSTGFYGKPGVNKTDFLVQLQMARSAGLVFLGYKLEAGPTYGIYCEDTREEILRRAARIAAKWGLSLADFPNFHFASLVGFTEPEFMWFDSNGKPKTTGALLRFDRKLKEIEAGLAVLDTAPHLFGGNEIARREVTKFIRQLDALSIGRKCAIVFSAHPSVRGQSARTLDSGSTAWEGSVRARISLHDPGQDEAGETGIRPSTDRRVLTLQKANYAKAGVTMELRCVEGFFSTTAVDPNEAAKRQAGPARDEACQAQFIDLLKKAREQGFYVSSLSAARDLYAPKKFTMMPSGKAFSLFEYKRAMEVLFEAGRLRLVPIGPPSRQKMVLTEAQP